MPNSFYKSMQQKSLVFKTSAPGIWKKVIRSYLAKHQAQGTTMYKTTNEQLPFLFMTSDLQEYEAAESYPAEQLNFISVTGAARSRETGTGLVPESL